MAEIFFIISCEHASHHIPRAYARWLTSPSAADHAGHDLGAATYARELAHALNAPLFTAPVSRLLVDANRSLHHPRLHGVGLREAPAKLRQEIVEIYYLPYRQQIEQAITDAIARKRRVIHLAAHSFTPRLDGITRNADVGLLYDPRRRWEKKLAVAWQAALQASAPDLSIRRNYPYRGSADGLTTALRKGYRDDEYVGFEIEINQAQWRQTPRAAARFRCWFVRETTRFFTQSCTALPKSRETKINARTSKIKSIPRY